MLIYHSDIDSWRRDTHATRHTPLRSHASGSETPDSSMVPVSTSRQSLPSTPRHPRYESGSPVNADSPHSWRAFAFRTDVRSARYEQFNSSTFHEFQNNLNPEDSTDYMARSVAVTSYQSTTSGNSVSQSVTPTLPPPPVPQGVTSPPDLGPTPLSSPSAAFTPSFGLHPIQPLNGPPVPSEPLQTEEPIESLNTGLEGIAGEHYVSSSLCPFVAFFNSDLPSPDI